MPNENLDDFFDNVKEIRKEIDGDSNRSDEGKKKIRDILHDLVKAVLHSNRE